MERILTRRITAEQGRQGAQLLSRSITKQIDVMMEQEMRGVTLEQRRALVQPLVDAAALHLVDAAAALADYPARAVAVAAAKSARDAGAVVEARRERNEVERRLDRALVSVVRALTGADT